MLPVLDTRVIETFKLPYLKQTIKIKPYKSSQEKALLNCLSNKDDKQKWIENILVILKDNIIDCNFDIEKLKVIDFLFIVMKLRSISKSNNFDLNFKCKGKITKEDGTEVDCNHTFKESIPLEELIKIKNQSIENIVFKVNDSLTLTLEPPNIDYLKYMSTLKIDEKEKYENIKNIFDIFINKISYSTKEIIIIENNVPTVYKEFTPEELRDNVLYNLTMEEINAIMEKLNSLISINFALKKQCPVCKKVYKDENSDFFIFLA